MPWVENVWSFAGVFWHVYKPHTLLSVWDSCLKFFGWQRVSIHQSPAFKQTHTLWRQQESRNVETLQTCNMEPCLPNFFRCFKVHTIFKTTDNLLHKQKTNNIYLYLYTESKKKQRIVRFSPCQGCTSWIKFGLSHLSSFPVVVRTRTNYVC